MRVKLYWLVGVLFLCLPLTPNVNAIASRQIVQVGEFAPSTNGGRYSLFLPPAINDNGDVALIAEVWGNEGKFFGPTLTLARGVFLSSNGNITAVALRGDPAPLTDGGVFASFSPNSFVPVAINDNKAIAFHATVHRSTSISDGIFLYSAEAISRVALTGMLAPGTGGKFSSIFPPAMNKNGVIAFVATLSGTAPPVVSGVFKYSGGVISPVVLAGQAVPGVNGASFLSFAYHFPPAINGKGDVVFTATILQGSAYIDGIFMASASGSLTTIALSGQQAPGAGGASFSAFVAGCAINDAGTVVFSTNLGLFRYSGGSLAAVVLIGQEAPLTNGGQFEAFSAPVINNLGDIAFNARMVGGIPGGVTRGVFMHTGGSLTALSAAGQPVPNHRANAGDVFSKLGYDYQPAINNKGAFVFVGTISRNPDPVTSPQAIDAIVMGNK